LYKKKSVPSLILLLVIHKCLAAFSKQLGSLAVAKAVMQLLGSHAVAESCYAAAWQPCSSSLPFNQICKAFFNLFTSELFFCMFV
jgi:hypothetical protein